MSRKLDPDKALSLNLYSAVDTDKLQYQWREIGCSEWIDTDSSDWILYCEQSPEHDTRVVNKRTLEKNNGQTN